jgi:hypothetical protein
MPSLHLWKHSSEKTFDSMRKLSDSMRCVTHCCKKVSAVVRLTPPNAVLQQQQEAVRVQGPQEVHHPRAHLLRCGNVWRQGFTLDQREQCMRHDVVNTTAQQEHQLEAQLITVSSEVNNTVTQQEQREPQPMSVSSEVSKTDSSVSCIS